MYRYIRLVISHLPDLVLLVIRTEIRSQGAQFAVPALIIVQLIASLLDLVMVY